MPISCNPNDLMQAAACFDSCVPAGFQPALQSFLLALINGGEMDPNKLMAAAQQAGFSKLSGKELEVIAYLLCQIAKNGGGVACGDQEGTGSPVGVKTPAFIGQLYTDTSGPNYWYSTGLTNADWTAITGGGARGGDTFGLFSYADSGAIGSVTINDATCVPGYDIESEPNITSLSWPNLVTIDPANLHVGYFLVVACPNLITISLPKLLSVRGTAFSLSVNPFQISGNNTALQTIDLSSVVTMASINSSYPKLVTILLSSLVSTSGTFGLYDSPFLTTIDLSSWIPSDGTNLTFSNNALSIASVELILRRCVLAGVTTCSIDVSGGTTAGLASLSVQGQADAASLLTAGNSLTMNP